MLVESIGARGSLIPHRQWARLAEYQPNLHDKRSGKNRHIVKVGSGNVAIIKNKTSPSQNARYRNIQWHIGLSHLDYLKTKAHLNSGQGH